MRGRCNSDPTLETSKTFLDESSKYRKNIGATAPNPVNDRENLTETPPRNSNLRDQYFHTPKFSEPLKCVKDPVGRAKPEDYKDTNWGKSDLDCVSNLDKFNISSEKFKKSCYIYKPRSKSTACEEELAYGSSDDDDEESSNRLGIHSTTYTIIDNL